MRQSFTDFTNREVGSGSCAIVHSRRTDNVILTVGTDTGEREDFIMREIREYNVNGTIILGVGNGYGSVKTAHRVFQTGIMKCDSEPVLTKEYIVYDGAYYIIGEGHKGFVANKQEDDDTYIMTLAAIESKSWTEKLGVNQCFIRIQNHIMDTTGVKLPEEIINQFLRKGEIDVSSKYQNMVKEIAEQYVKELFDKLRDYEYNEDLMKLYVMGGGAKMVEMFGKYNPDRTTFNHDICANAKGYEYFCYMMLRQKMRK